MHHSSLKNSNPEWTIAGRIIFRVLFIFLLLLALPLDWKYYYQIATIHWSNLSYRDLFYISRYTPQFSGLFLEGQTWGFSTISDWVIIFLLAVAGGITWSFFDKKRKSYPDLYYLLRVIIRYRLSIAVISYGFIKLFPLQLPYPSLSLLNTNYGDLSDWKIATLSYGIVPSFESFLGAVEVAAGVLLLFRKSASVGAAIVIGFTGNVLLSQWGYGGGEWLYCFYLLTMAVVLLWFDAERWYNLLVLAKPTAPNRYTPAFFTGWKREARYIGKALMLAFMIPLFGLLAYDLYKTGAYHYPSTNGLAHAEGLYNVSEFRLNGKEIPYSLTDSARWQNVVFERWNSISIRTAKPIIAQVRNTEEIFLRSEERDFESTESVGRHFYRYNIDSSNQVLQLENKNIHYTNDRMFLRYSRPGPGRIILTGKNNEGDEIEVVLDKLNKEYILNESVNIPLNRSVFKQW